MKKILALVLSLMMLFSTFALSANAVLVTIGDGDSYSKWEELSEFEDFPYYNAYPNGKTPTIDGEIAADEYMVKIELSDDDITHNVGGAKAGSIPEFVNIYIQVDANNVYFGLEIQNDKAENAYYKDADGNIAEGWMDWRLTFAGTSSQVIEPVYTDGKYYNITLRPRLDKGKTTTKIIGEPGAELSYDWFNWTQETFEAAFIDATYKFNVDATDPNKSYVAYELAFTKAGILAAHGHTGGTLRYIHVGLWCNTIWAEPNADGVMASIPNSRVGWGYAVDTDLSMKTDLVLPVGKANYDCDKCIICVAITDDPVVITIVCGGLHSTTTTTYPNCGEALPPPKTNTTTTAATEANSDTTTLSATTTTSAATTAATSEPTEGGCGSALAVSAAALIPALGVALVASKKRED
ncbi:MAG: hypothetical protein E7641_05360 [Ruminococcaceae bacterium]|nr:hypothetical protein [Oscillospiraceae bacterium]